MSCVTGESLAARAEAIRFQVFYRSLMHRYMRDQILGRKPEESLREQLARLTPEDQDRLLFLLEHRLLPMHQPKKPFKSGFSEGAGFGWFISVISFTYNEGNRIHTYCQGIITRARV
jgi:hypothetical protein